MLSTASGEAALSMMRVSTVSEAKKLVHTALYSCRSRRKAKTVFLSSRSNAKNRDVCLFGLTIL